MGDGAVGQEERHPIRLRASQDVRGGGAEVAQQVLHDGSGDEGQRPPQAARVGGEQLCPPFSQQIRQHAPLLAEARASGSSEDPLGLGDGLDRLGLQLYRQRRVVAPDQVAEGGPDQRGHDRRPGAVAHQEASVLERVKRGWTAVDLVEEGGERPVRDRLKVGRLGHVPAAFHVLDPVLERGGKHRALPNAQRGRRLQRQCEVQPPAGDGMDLVDGVGTRPRDGVAVGARDLGRRLRPRVHRTAERIDLLRREEEVGSAGQLPVDLRERLPVDVQGVEDDCDPRRGPIL